MSREAGQNSKMEAELDDLKGRVKNLELQFEQVNIGFTSGIADSPLFKLFVEWGASSVH